MNTRIVLALVATAAVAAGCGGKSSGGASPAAAPTVTVTATPSTGGATTAPVSTASATASPTASPGSAGGSPCRTGNLTISLSAGGAAAGTFYQNLIFTNNGSASCTLLGRPGVSFTNQAHQQIGEPASSDPGKARKVTLAPGGKASASLRQPDPANYSASDCHKTTSAFLKVYPPGETVPAYVTDKAQYCTTSAARAGIGPVVPGTNATNG